MALCHINEITDDYEHPEKNVEYVLENVLSDPISHCEEFELLKAQYNSVLLKSCQCQQQNQCDEVDCLHGGNYILLCDADKPAELVLSPKIRSDVIYECSALCACERRKCRNRLVQNGPRQHLKVVQSKVCASLGVITTTDIPKGGFICEYAGELLTHIDAQRRVKENERDQKMNYVLCLNERLTSDLTLSEAIGKLLYTIVDPSRRGNIGRYLNHSCLPNCEILSVRVDCPIPKIAIFAKRKIQADEELCFHYGGESATSEARADNEHSNKKPNAPCLCRSVNCLKYLPNIEF